MWKVSNTRSNGDTMEIILVDTEDDEFWIVVDQIRLQVLDDMGLITYD